MLIVLLLGAVMVALASAGLWLRELWQAVPHSNRDFAWEAIEGEGA